MIRKTLCYLFFGISLISIYAQDSNYQVTMVKNILKQFDELKPGEAEYPENQEKYASFEPLGETLKVNIYDEALSDMDDLFSLDDINGGYTEIDGKEFTTSNARLVFSYEALPGFQNVNAWFELSSVKDKNGKKLLMDEKMMEKYREYGIIEDEFNYPVPGEFSATIWFNRELKWEEAIDISGHLFLEVPDEYDIAVLTGSDISKAVSVAGIEFTLLSIDKNIVTCQVKGDRRKLESVKVILLNAQGKPYLSNQSIAIDAGMYDLQTKMTKTLTDEDIETNIANADYSNTMVDQVKKIQVYGPVEKVVFLKVNTFKSIEKEFGVEEVVSF